MADSAGPRILFAEWLPIGIVVHFAGGESVFYSAEFLHQHRQSPGNKLLHQDPSLHERNGHEHTDPGD